MDSQKGISRQTDNSYQLSKGMFRQISALEGEERAAEILKKSGYKILQRNYRSKYGEIDIIAYDRCVIVFVEVKS